LNAGPRPAPALHQVEIGADSGVSLRMGNDRLQAARNELPDSEGAVWRNAHIRELDEHKRRSGQPQSWVLYSRVRYVERDFHPPFDAKVRELRDGKRGELLPGRVDRVQEVPEVSWTPDIRCQEMRGGNDLPDALTLKNRKPVPRFIEVRRAVIDARHQVIMEVEHSWGM
jgi:hypothetical protein